MEMTISSIVTRSLGIVPMKLWKNWEKQRKREESITENNVKKILKSHSDVLSLNYVLRHLTKLSE